MRNLYLALLGLDSNDLDFEPEQRGRSFLRLHKDEWVMRSEIFLDNNATTQSLQEVTAAVVAAMSESFGNASSSNRSGERARRLLVDSRESLGRLIGASSDSINFTSGAT